MVKLLGYKYVMQLINHVCNYFHCRDMQPTCNTTFLDVIHIFVDNSLYYWGQVGRIVNNISIRVQHITHKADGFCLEDQSCHLFFAFCCVFYIEGVSC